MTASEGPVAWRLSTKKAGLPSYRVGYFVSQCHATFMCEDTFVFAPRVLYLDRIRWFPDSRTGIHPEYIRIHQNTSEYCIHRTPPQIS